MLSFWEQESFIRYQYLVVGAGIVGLSTALSIKEQNPKAKVVVLERSLFPSGASTKNAGFACFGSLSELCTDIAQMGRHNAYELVQLRWQGLQLLRSRLSDAQLGYQANGGYELIRQAELHYLDRLDEINEWLHPLFEQNVFTERPELLHLFGFNSSEVKAIVGNPFEGQIHTGQMMKNLYLKATALGIEVITGATVSDIEDEGHQVKVWAKQADATNSEICFLADKVAVCTNAFTKQLYPNLELQPGRGLVMITKPMANLPWKGVFHYDEGYYYFRNVGNRILFGGGRNLDFHGETTTRFGINPHILDRLKSDLHELIIPNQAFEIDQVWSGIMAFGTDKQPITKLHSLNVALGVRMGGMGVAIGSRIGQQLAQLLLP